MHLQSACDAIDRGCRLEIYYDDHSLVVEPHAVGFDRRGRTMLLAWECSDSADGHSGEWLFLTLDEAREVDVSGYLAQSPRMGFVRDDPRFARIVRQV